MPESDPVVSSACHKNMRGKDRIDQSASSEAPPKRWHENHFLHMLKAGKVWGRKFGPEQADGEELMKQLPHLQRLTERELDHLQCWGIDLPDKGGVPRLKDLSQAPERSQAQCGRSPCITPRGRVWVSTRARLLTGLEKCWLQSLFFPESFLRAHAEQDDNFLSELAGAP